MIDKVQRIRVTREDIERVKQQHILENLSYSVQEAAQIIGCKVRKIYQLVDTGDLIDANDTPGKKGTRITALSINTYHEKRIRLAGEARGVSRSNF
ncbi:helix-turn-helix domain-containing protein [Geopsychrobacter electrodiphilus]|uniref:helix-turn-helix domain-containing protein n=1 Tax=Geopsychrobacter electrodiphilus TaxID=225196 RepID=UPI0003805A26|nr:helix-turn-helix domain-containing protein [Geopsychrobacter electrodiphilus]